eukprot:365674-Chlamydomonas_euryale.AAC.10
MRHVEGRLSADRLVGLAGSPQTRPELPDTNLARSPVSGGRRQLRFFERCAAPCRWRMLGPPEILEDSPVLDSCPGLLHHRTSKHLPPREADSHSPTRARSGATTRAGLRTMRQRADGATWSGVGRGVGTDGRKAFEHKRST